MEDFCRTGDFELDLERGLWTVVDRRCAEARRGGSWVYLGNSMELISLPALLSCIFISVPDIRRAIDQLTS